MRKIIYSVIITTLLLLFSFPAHAKEKITLAGDKNYPPYEFVDKDGQYVGFNVDIMKALSIEMGKEINIIPMDWMKAHKDLIDGNIDGIQGMSFNEERKRIYNFSDEYLNDSLVIFTLKENREIHNISSLKGKKVSVQRHGIGAYILSDVGEIEVEFSNDIQDSFKQLSNGKVDAVLGNKANALYSIKELSMQDKVKAIAYDIAPTPYGVAFNINDNKLPEEFNEAIKNIKANGTYQKIYEKWFGDIYDESNENLKKITPLLIIALCLVMLVVIVITRINKALKNEVIKRTEEIEKKNRELHDNLAFKEQLISSMRSGLITLNPEGVVSDINKKTEEILGCRLMSEKGKHFEDSLIINYIESDKIKMVIDSGIAFNSLENTISSELGKVVFVYDIYPFHNYDKSNTGTLIVIRDITEMVLLREKLKQRDKLESLGLLVSSIAHEIRNPLTAIKNYIDLLPLKYDNPRFRDKITEQLPVEIDRLNNLLTNLLEYSKPKQFKKEHWNLKLELDEILFFLRTRLNEKKIVVNNNVHDSIEIFSDKQQIRQVIINIILNGIEAIDSNGTIAIETEDLNDRVKIYITDDGIGIDENEISKAFDPFFTTKHSGTGLGLSTSYTIMKENNGDIMIRNLENGTQVELIFYKNEEDNYEANIDNR